MTSAARSSLIGAGLGAAVMFLADPARGARRRALMRHKLMWASRKTRDGAAATWRHLNNRAAGLRARAMTSSETVDDSTLTERIRAALGRATSHPGALTVAASNGWVVLSGDALAADVPSIIAAVDRVPGVEGVRNEIRSFVTPGNIPALQGTRSTGRRRRRAWRSSAWSPTAKLGVGAGIGMCMLAAAMGRRQSI